MPINICKLILLLATINAAKIILYDYSTTTTYLSDQASSGPNPTLTSTSVTHINNLAYFQPASSLTSNPFIPWGSSFTVYATVYLISTASELTILDWGVQDMPQLKLISNGEVYYRLNVYISPHTPIYHQWYGSGKIAPLSKYVSR